MEREAFTRYVERLVKEADSGEGHALPEDVDRYLSCGQLPERLERIRVKETVDNELYRDLGLAGNNREWHNRVDQERFTPLPPMVGEQVSITTCDDSDKGMRNLAARLDVSLVGVPMDVELVREQDMLSDDGNNKDSSRADDDESACDGMEGQAGIHIRNVGVVDLKVGHCRDTGYWGWP